MIPFLMDEKNQGSAITRDSSSSRRSRPPDTDACLLFIPSFGKPEGWGAGRK